MPRGQIGHLIETQYKLKGTVPLAKSALSARLPVHVDKAVRELAGDDISGWLRQAVEEKLERECQQQKAS